MATRAICPRCGDPAPVTNTCAVCKRENLDNYCISVSKKARDLGYTYPLAICVDCINLPIKHLRR